MVSAYTILPGLSVFLVKTDFRRMFLYTLIQNESIKSHTENGDEKKGFNVFPYITKKCEKNRKSIRPGTKIASFVRLKEAIPGGGYG
jgi:hypothetical protein